MKYYQEHRDLILKIELFIIFALVIVILIILFTKEEPIENNEISIAKPPSTTIPITDSKKEHYVDIKGAVKKPGVYKVSEGAIVNDVIKLAGGLKSTAYTANINLSQSTKDEMVIYIYTKSEVKKTTSPIITDTTCTTNVIEVNNCITTTTTTSIKSSLVNINTATEEELMTLSGIGASKATAIIAYRKENKFNSIEDLKNVSGIGEALYDQVKDHITV